MLVVLRGLRLQASGRHGCLIAPSVLNIHLVTTICTMPSREITMNIEDEALETVLAILEGANSHSTDAHVRTFICALRHAVSYPASNSSMRSDVSMHSAVSSNVSMISVEPDWGAFSLLQSMSYISDVQHYPGLQTPEPETSPLAHISGRDQLRTPSPQEDLMSHYPPMSSPLPNEDDIQNFDPSDKLILNDEDLDGLEQMHGQGNRTWGACV